jgi:hypothetical protein
MNTSRPARPLRAVFIRALNATATSYPITQSLTAAQPEVTGGKRRWDFFLDMDFQLLRLFQLRRRLRLRLRLRFLFLTLGGIPLVFVVLARPFPGVFLFLGLTFRSLLFPGRAEGV